MKFRHCVDDSNACKLIKFNSLVKQYYYNH